VPHLNTPEPRKWNWVSLLVVGGELMGSAGGSASTKNKNTLNHKKIRFLLCFFLPNNKSKSLETIVAFFLPNFNHFLLWKRKRE